MEESLLAALRHLAEKERMSVSAAIRAALEEYDCRRHSATTLPSFIGLGRSGRKDIAEHAEDLLWISPHKGRKR